ncbi:hypothetical protein EAY39_07805 [Vibrio anguillarum]|nr:hypothetical protein [Vibrio anguillarum]MBS3661161.1 hypothetical protein [Vibrio cholerae]MVB86565.1 hypothetical protein [Vibrio cholerae]
MWRTIMPKEQIKKEYTHYAWMFGVVPVYLRIDSEGQIEEMCTRNYVPVWTGQLARFLFRIFALPIELIGQGERFVQHWFKITGTIK